MINNLIYHFIKIILTILTLLTLFACASESQITQPDENNIDEGKVYSVVTIGTQVWIDENLNVGEMIISSSEEDNQSDNSKIEKYCYENNPEFCDKYGGLYQWDEAMQYQISEGARGICPEGFHIPTLSELEELSEYVNSKSKSLVDTNETPVSYRPNNDTKFTGYFSGYRGSNGQYYDLGLGGYFLSSSQEIENYAYSLSLISSYSDIYLNGRKKEYGISVRCIKD